MASAQGLEDTKPAGGRARAARPLSALLTKEEYGGVWCKGTECTVALEESSEESRGECQFNRMQGQL